MVGKKLDGLRTPSLVIDKTILERNCVQLGKISTELNTNIRIHVKTHKVYCGKKNVLLYSSVDTVIQTVEGARIQLEGAKSNAIVVSTMAEAYTMVDSELTESGLLQDVRFKMWTSLQLKGQQLLNILDVQVLLGFPITPDKFDDIVKLSKKVNTFQIFIGKDQQFRLNPVVFTHSHQIMYSPYKLWSHIVKCLAIHTRSMGF